MIRHTPDLLRRPVRLKAMSPGREGVGVSTNTHSGGIGVHPTALPGVVDGVPMLAAGGVWEPPDKPQPDADINVHKNNNAVARDVKPRSHL